MRPADQIQYFQCSLRRIGVIIFFSFALLYPASGQISPGDLSQAHAQYEGISNCTKCHVLGERITNAKCLECHDIIKNNISLGKGYHASKEVEGKYCYSCHSDHHGRKFQLIKFDKNNFDHKTAGYELSGKHREIECAECHNPEYIRDEKLKNKKFTWLGLSKDCRSCHPDYHQNTLSADCASCHNYDSFRPAPGFDHQKSAFPLKGKHSSTDCYKCHPESNKEGKKFTQFVGIKFSNCTNCHKDPHSNNFGQNCRSCHNEDSFRKLISSNAFDHTKTGFQLTGKHQSVSCILCHKGNYSQPLPHSKCIDCHTDYHKSQFEKNGIQPDCSECHTTEGFSQTSVTIDRHNKTNFPLTGSHQTASCASCHKKTETWKFINIGKSCADCHSNYHKDEFQAGKCEECHDTKSFANVMYSIDQHNKIFPLEGAHLATPCFSCHKKSGEKWNFSTGEKCIDCHLNIHQGVLKEKYYPGQECRNCHNVNSWKEIAFNHSLTAFTLLGKHNEISCSSCHLFKKVNGKYEQNFTLNKRECQSCHDDIHEGQFEKNNVTYCNQCHGQNNWKAVLFDHNSTGFKLGASHEKLNCTACHEVVRNEKGTYTKYKLNKIKCADCHF